MKSFAGFVQAFLVGLLTVNVVIGAAVLAAAYTNIVVTVIVSIIAALVCIVASFVSKLSSPRIRGAVMLAACIGMGPAAICSTNIFDYCYARRGDVIKSVSLAEAAACDNGRIFYLTNGIVLRDYEGTHIRSDNSHRNRPVRTFYRASPIVEDKYVDQETMRFDKSGVKVLAWAVRGSSRNDASVLVEVPGTDTVTARGKDSDGAVYAMTAIRAGRDLKEYGKAIADSVVSCGVTTTEDPLIVQLYADPEETLAGYLQSAMLACKVFNLVWLIGYPLLAIVSALVALKKRRRGEAAAPREAGRAEG